MSATLTIHLDSSVHADNCNLRPSITLGKGGGYRQMLTINFGRRGKIRVKVVSEDVRRLAKQLIRLADSHAVACGERQVAQ